MGPLAVHHRHQAVLHQRVRRASRVNVGVGWVFCFVGLAFLAFESLYEHFRALLRKEEAVAILRAQAERQVSFQQNLHEATSISRGFSLEKLYLVNAQALGMIIDVGTYIGDCSHWAAEQLRSRMALLSPLRNSSVFWSRL